MKASEENVLASTGAYVLNAMDKDERTRFETQLRFSAAAREEVTELSDTAVLLSDLTPEVQPSADLKSKLMAQIATTPQFTAEPEVETNAIITPISSTRTTNIKTAQLKAKNRWFARATIAGMSVAAAAIVIAGVALPHNNAPTTAPQAASYSTLTHSADKQQTSGSTTNGGSITVLWSDTAKTAAVNVHELPPLASGKTYEMWLVNKQGVARAAGLLTSSQTHKTLEGTLNPGDSVAVTVEPAGGSTSPTGKPVFLAET